MIVNDDGSWPEDVAPVRSTGFVYAFRYGDGDHVKVGATNDLAKRERQLQVAHHNPLVLAELIEHVDYKEGEKYIHELLAARRVQQSGNGAREHFCVNDAGLGEVFVKGREYLDEELPRQRQVEKYEAMQAGDVFLPATDEALEAQRRLRELRAARVQLQPEKERLDDEIRAVQRRQQPMRERLNRRLAELDAEEDRLVTTMKLAIGPARGIDGVASWESVAKGRRSFNEESLRESHPDLWEGYLTAFDKQRFKEEHPAVYDAHLRAKTCREFRWTDDDRTDGDTDPPGVQSGRRRGVLRTMRKHPTL